MLQLITIAIGSFLLLDIVPMSSSPVDRPSYSDEFARTKVVPLCAATEGTTPQTCLDRFFKNTTATRKVTVKCDNLFNKCSGYVAINHDDKAIIIAFRSSVGIIQMISEFETTLKDTMVKWIAGGYVSKYFHDAFIRVWTAGIEDDFVKLSKRNQDYELWIVGHSLGGAMASLAASYIEKMKLFDGGRIKLVTFGQPRTGDMDFANVHGLQIPYSFRVTHSHDVVPHVPPEGFEGYHHHKSEVFYNNNMTSADHVECDEGESLKCSDGFVDTSFNDHHRYFNVFISKWGKAGCPDDVVNANDTVNPS